MTGDADTVAARKSGMQLEHRVGQLILIGLPGTQLDPATRGFISSVQPGGVLLTSRNIESAQQVVELTSAIRSLIKVPPLIAINQEGGLFDHLKPIYSAMPSADLLRASKEAAVASRLGDITAEALRTLGFNTNFAPVLDIALDDSADNGLKGRYLGNTAADVIRLAGAYLEGLQRGGVVGVGKHFPGLGGATSNPEDELPTIDRSRDQLMNQDIAPYVELFSKINARLAAVIVAHAHYPAFDGPARLPASLSKNIVTGLLREELGFKGLVITSDLELCAQWQGRPGMAEVAPMAIEAGVDMIMVTGSIEAAAEAWEALLKAAREGHISSQRISRSFDHIARVKAMLSPPHTLTEMTIMRLRERIGELNLILQHSR
jgi:beta-N-acetylhexosaminidase